MSNTERVLTRPVSTAAAELGLMVERILIFEELYRANEDKARAYWGFVERGYAESGYDLDVINRQEDEADKIIGEIKCELEGMVNVR